MLDQNGEPYRTQGRTVVATNPGHVYRPVDQSLPEITDAGVTVTRAQADTLIEETAGLGNRYLFIVEDVDPGIEVSVN